MAGRVKLSNGTTVLADVKNITFHEAVNSADNIRPGCVGSAYIEVEAFGTQSNAVTAGQELRYYYVNKSGTETLIGHFFAEPAITTKKTYSFVAYDNTAKLDVDFSSWLAANQESFPMTVYQLVSAACAIAGVTLGSSSWSNSTLSVQAFYADNLTCRNILEYAAEIGCKFVHCNSAGQIIFDWYATYNSYSIRPGATSSSYIAYKQDGLKYENYTTTALARVAVYPSGTDDAAYIYPSNVTSGNTLSISGNLLLTGASASTYNTVAQTVYTAMNNLGTYKPMTVNLFPSENPFRAGKKISVTDSQSVSFTTIITEMLTSDSDATLISSGAKEYRATGGDVAKTIANISNDIVRINNLKADTAEVNLLISSVQSTAEGAASAASTAQATANGANAQEQLIYKSAASGTSSMSGTTTWVTSTSDTQNAWTLKRPTYNSSYPVLFVATQRKTVGGTVTCTTPIKDDTTTVIDGGHITTGTIDASAVTVTNINANNITSGTINGSNVNVKNLNVIDGSSNVISTYSGSGITLGQTSQSNMKLDSRSFKLVDKDGHTFLEARDLRNASGIAEVVDYFVGDGNSTTFYLSATPIGSVSVTIDSVATSAYTITDDTVLRFNQAPRTGAEIRVAYNGDSMSLVEMTLGSRNDSYPVGATSFTVGSGNVATGPYTRAFGFDTRAHGYYSGAEGSNTVALGYASHAEGTLTNASGDSSHAEGRESNASGVYSHAQNYGTDASGLAQTALGMYNVSDPSGTYAVIIGNGSDDSLRSNALTIDWSGNVNTAGNVTANGVSVSELNKKALGIRGQIGALSSWNIDSMASNENYGTWWLNVGDADIAGTKPTSSGHGLLFCTRQSSGISRQYYRGVTVRGDYHRYYTHSTGVWTAWEPVPGIPLIDSFTGTTSANGNFSHAFSSNVVVLSSWANTSDKIVSAYPSGGTTTGGATTWWFHVRNANANGTVVASTSTTVTVSYMYV